MFITVLVSINKSIANQNIIVNETNSYTNDKTNKDIKHKYFTCSELYF